MRYAKLSTLVLCSLPAFACSFSASFELEAGDEPEMDLRCNAPTHAVVRRVIDGDTIELEGGERVRYLMIDTPESVGELECWGEEAKLANAQFVEGQEIELEYDAECADKYDRLLAYIWVNDTSINELLVERGHASVFHIPPNGDAVIGIYEDLEAQARAANKGQWGACE